jgi:hypothetical protein
VDLVGENNVQAVDLIQTADLLLAVNQRLSEFQADHQVDQGEHTNTEKVDCPSQH